MFGKQTLIIREKHVACCRAAGAHLNFNLAKGGRQEGRRAVKCEVVKGKSATSPITQRWESFVSVWGLLIQLFSRSLFSKRTRKEGVHENQKRMNCSKLFMVNYRLVCSSSLQPGNVWQPCCDWAGYLGFSQSFGIVWIFNAFLPKATHQSPPEPQWRRQRYYF